jgi:RNA polymerase sigma factor (sigma-70 family)
MNDTPATPPSADFTALRSALREYLYALWLKLRNIGTLSHFALSYDLLDEKTTRDEVDGTLYDRFALAIFTYLCQQVSNEQDAEDLLVEVFLAAFKSEELSSLSAGRQLAWLQRVARNKVVDRYRHLALLTLVPIEQASEMEDGAPTPEQYTEQQENYEHLYRALEQLLPLQRELIGLRYRQGLRFIEIAGILEKSEGAVRKLCTRTLQQLRGIYSQTERGSSDETDR